MRCYYTAYLTFLFCAAIGQCRGDIPDEYFLSWKEFNKQFEDYSVEASGVSNTQHGEKSIVAKSRSTYVFSGACVRIVLQHWSSPAELKPSSHSVLAVNSKYAFTLTHTKNGFVISEYALIDDPKARVIINETNKYRKSGSIAIDNSLIDDIADKLSLIDGTRLSNVGGFSVQIGKRKERQYNKLHISLDNTKYRMPLSVHSEVVENGTNCIYDTNYEYDTIGGAYVAVAIKNAKQYLLAGQSPVHETNECHYQYDFSRKSESEFTLSYYGLPEPAGIEWTKPTPNYVWLLLAAVGAGILALGSRCLARRKRNSAPAIP